MQFPFNPFNQYYHTGAPVNQLNVPFQELNPTQNHLHQNFPPAMSIYPQHQGYMQSLMPRPQPNFGYPYHPFQFQQPFMNPQAYLPDVTIQQMTQKIPPQQTSVSTPKPLKQTEKVLIENGKSIVVIDSDEEVQEVSRTVQQHKQYPQQMQSVIAYPQNVMQPQFQKFSYPSFQYCLPFNYNSVMVRGPQIAPPVPIPENAKVKKQKKRDGKIQMPREIKPQYYQQINLIEKPAANQSKRMLDLDYLERSGQIYEPERDKKRSKVSELLSVQVRTRVYSPEYSILQPRKPKIQKQIKPKQESNKQESSTPMCEKKKERQIGFNHQAVIPRFQLMFQTRFIKRFDRSRISSEQFETLLQDLRKTQPLATDEDVAQVANCCEYSFERCLQYIEENAQVLAYYIEARREEIKEDEVEGVPRKKANNVKD